MTSEAKQPKTKKGKNPSKVQKGPVNQTPPPVKKPEPLFHLMGKKRVTFVGVARELSEVLLDTYGEEMSISKFERILLELKGQETLKDKIYILDSLLSLHTKYLVAKKDMIEEQNLFKSSFSTKPVETVAATNVAELFASSAHPVQSTVTPTPGSTMPPKSG